MAHIAVHVQDCSGAAMPDVEVTATGQPNGFTDSQGNWDFGDVPPGMYTVTGLLANSTPASQTLQAPAGQKTTFNLVFCAIKVGIQILNDGVPNDYVVVQMKCDHPAHRHLEACQIKLTSGAAHDHQITLGNPDGRLRFHEAGDVAGDRPLKNLTLRVNTSGTTFQISGETGSAALRDAIIEARLAATCPDGGASAIGDLKGTKPATVFWFDAASIQLTQGGNYSLVNGKHDVVPRPAVWFSAQATIKPDQVGCQAPQTKNLRIAIMQEVNRDIATSYWSSTGSADWDAAAPVPFSLEVPTNVRECCSTDYDRVTEPVIDSDKVSNPLYDRGLGALQRPTGCPGSAPARTSDTPNWALQDVLQQDLKTQDGLTVVGKGNWSLVRVTRRADFHTFCVVFNTATGTYCCLRQATWSLNLDTSGAPADQQAVVNPDGPVTSDPATGNIVANDACLVGNPDVVGSDKTTLTNPNP
jgi:hypothetical protein